MSPRAAWRLERYGFSQVYDYVLGKSDWLSYELPYEGEAVLAGSAAIRDLPTCREHDRVSDVIGQADASPIGAVTVVNDAGVLIGLLVPDEADDADARVGEAMREGPTSVRPSEELDELRHRMVHAGADSILVTRPDGTLVGAVLAR